MSSSILTQNGFLSEVDQILNILERGTIVTRFYLKKRPEKRTLRIRKETRQLLWSRTSVTSCKTIDGSRKYILIFFYFQPHRSVYSYVHWQSIFFFQWISRISKNYDVVGKAKNLIDGPTSWKSLNLPNVLSYSTDANSNLKISPLSVCDCR